jgi:hypothetical protein
MRLNSPGERWEFSLISLYYNNKSLYYLYKNPTLPLSYFM